MRAETLPSIPAAAMSTRIVSVDLLRGLIMIVMALDHVRDYFTPYPWDPTDLSKASAALFLTRWITHYCAPIFVFLAGTSAYLYRRNSGCSRAHLQWFLVTRGLWLVLLEITLISFFWQFGYHGMILQTLWSLGWSMVALALLLYLPTWAMLAIAFAMIFGHNLLDGIHPQDFGAFAIGWAIRTSSISTRSRRTSSSRSAIRLSRGSASWPQVTDSAACSSSNARGAIAC
ncbi:MAG TPA: heparan-alpha-glucosaminide N-acetyltransferase domain-containing protein [Rhodanobacteraceae bacterium]|nr:heparan-alpha-glucosaminide N-acetyltransferase domain-containing protein [Rhodanobacteraceae bacterium]